MFKCSVQSKYLLLLDYQGSSTPNMNVSEVNVLILDKMLQRLGPFLYGFEDSNVHDSSCVCQDYFTNRFEGLGRSFKIIGWICDLVNGNWYSSLCMLLWSGYLWENTHS